MRVYATKSLRPKEFGIFTVLAFIEYKIVLSDYKKLLLKIWGWNSINSGGNYNPAKHRQTKYRIPVQEEEYRSKILSWLLLFSVYFNLCLIEWNREYSDLVITLPFLPSYLTLIWLVTNLALTISFLKIKVLTSLVYKGRQVFSKIVRDNKEIEYVANNKYYDFNYQYTNFLQKPVVLKRVTCWDMKLNYLITFKLAICELEINL